MELYHMPMYDGFTLVFDVDIIGPAEAESLYRIAKNHNREVTDMDLVNWKRGRGPGSSSNMDIKSVRNRWLREARRIQLTCHLNRKHFPA